MASKPRDLRRTILLALNQHATRTKKLFESEKKALKAMEDEGKPVVLDEDLNDAYELLVKLADCLFKIGGAQPVVAVSPEGEESPEEAPEEEPEEDSEELARKKKEFLRRFSKGG